MSTFYSLKESVVNSVLSSQQLSLDNSCLLGLFHSLSARESLSLCWNTSFNIGLSSRRRHTSRYELDHLVGQSVTTVLPERAITYWVATDENLMLVAIDLASVIA